MRPALYVDVDADLYISTIQCLEWLFCSGLMRAGSRNGTVVRYDDWGGPTGAHELVGERRAHLEVTNRHSVHWRHSGLLGNWFRVTSYRLDHGWCAARGYPPLPPNIGFDGDVPRPSELWRQSPTRARRSPTHGTHRAEAKGGAARLISPRVCAWPRKRPASGAQLRSGRACVSSSCLVCRGARRSVGGGDRWLLQPHEHVDGRALRQAERRAAALLRALPAPHALDVRMGAQAARGADERLRRRRARRGRAARAAARVRHAGRRRRRQGGEEWWRPRRGKEEEAAAGGGDVRGAPLWRREARCRMILEGGGGGGGGGDATVVAVAALDIDGAGGDTARGEGAGEGRGMGGAAAAADGSAGQAGRGDGGVSAQSGGGTGLAARLGGADLRKSV
eukprot:82265-Prymnesium_polylepis.1